MRQPFCNLIVVGQGAAGLAAALAAAEMARVRSWPIAVTLVDKAAENEAGGNTRWSPSYMRMASPTHMEATFMADMREGPSAKAMSLFCASSGGGARHGEVDRLKWHRIHSADILPR